VRRDRRADTCPMNVRGRPQAARYAVVFRAGPGAPASGALVIQEDSVLLEGRDADRRVEVSVPYQELLEVRIGRRPEERLHGRPTLLVSRANGPQVQIEPFGAGLLHEIADLLATLANERSRSGEEVVVIVPLKEGCMAHVKELVAQGPPFDPAALGFTDHRVLLTVDQAILVFVGPKVRTTLERATRDPTLWRAGLAWRGCIAGRPRLSTIRADELRPDAQLVYSWAANGEQSSPAG